jgi:hypothetical protein
MALLCRPRRSKAARAAAGSAQLTSTPNQRSVERKTDDDELNPALVI